MADRIPPTREPIDLVCRIYWNVFNRRKHLQLEMVDWRLAQVPLSAALEQV
jgi:hypothetical protein